MSTPIKDLLAGLKVPTGLTSAADHDARVDAVAAQVEAEIADQRTTIAQLAGIMRAMLAGSQSATKDARDYLVTRTVVRAIEERRAIEAVVAAWDTLDEAHTGECWDTSMGSCACGLLARQLKARAVILAYRAQRGSK